MVAVQPTTTRCTHVIERLYVHGGALNHVTSRPRLRPLQVQKFLESSCSLPDFVERYRRLYVRLKTAMEEMFGQQTAFVLALRQGFSGALLQLSVLRATHVSPSTRTRTHTHTHSWLTHGATD